MKPQLVLRLEKTLVLFLLLSFLGPLAIGGWLHVTKTNSIGTAWLRNYTLAGSVFEPEKVPLSHDTLLSGKYQSAYAKNFDSNFPARELLIRIINEIYLRAFKSSTAGVIIGPDWTLYDTAYTTEYGIVRRDKDNLRPLVQDMKRMQDFCNARGIAFALLITPSKASVYPEKMPAEWQRRYNPGLRGYDSLIPLLKEHGIHYADGHQVLVDLKPKVRLPLYPLGGIHWGSEAATAVGNELLDVLGKQGLPVRAVHDLKIDYTDNPTDKRDRDLADFLNPIIPLRYEVAEVTPRPVDTGNAYRPNAVFIGGSFVWKMISILDATNQFSELEYYYYYTLSKNCEVYGQVHTLAEPAPPMNFDTDIFAADALVFELNEQALYLPNHISRFLRDVLPKLPDPHSPKAPYRYEGQQSYKWGDTLSLVSGKNPVKILTGFTNPGPEGAYTDGYESSLHFNVTPATEDMRLEVTASPFLWGKLVPNQHVNVSVNGRRAGEWTWDVGGTSKREMVIPKEFLTGDKLVLVFHLPNASSPSELGLFPEYRKLGISISSIRLQPTSEFEPGETPLAYKWGDTLSFLAGKNPVLPPATHGFTSPSEQGTYTDGPVASVHFAAPPATEDMTLQVNAVAFLVENRVREQKVKVSVNSQPVGEFVWNGSANSRHEMTIPKEYLGSGRVLLDFWLPNAVSPAELGMYAEQRKLGINVSSIVLYPASGFSPDAHPLAYKYGSPISFRAGRDAVGADATAGFTPPGDTGSFTDGPVATLQFLAPPATEDMQLAINGGAFLVKDRVPQQRVEVSINGHPLGRLTWKEGDTAQHVLSMPKTYLPGGKTVLEFRLPDATAPADLGMGGERRKLGILVTDITFSAAPLSTSDPNTLSYKYGSQLSFVSGKNPVLASATSGFTPPGDQGAFTDGPVVTIRFSAPPAETDMNLEVEAFAFVADTRVPKQVVKAFVNGRLLGEWTWKDAVAKQSFVVPRATLPGGPTVLEFQIPHATAPADLELYGEHRKLGICVSSVSLTPLGK